VSITSDAGDFFNSLKNLSQDEKRELAVIAIIFLVLMAAAIFSLKNFAWLINPDTDTSFNEPAITDTAGIEAGEKADDVSSKYDSYVKSRAYSSQMVTLAKSVGRYPICDAQAELAPAPSVVPVSGEAPVKVAEFIPTMKIKALVVMGSGGAATVDIDGERPGQIVRNGSVFGGGKGMITAIDAGGVSWTWSHRKFHTNL
jgi:hypothetical protein